MNPHPSRPMPRRSRPKVSASHSCDIIIPIHDNLEDTRNCLERIAEATPPVSYRLVLVDDGSTPATAGWLDFIAQSDFYGPTLLLRRPKSGGWTDATNHGLAHSEAPFLCLMNNDTLAATGWLSRMIEHFRRHPDMGLMQPSGNEGHWRGISPGDVEGRAVEMAQAHHGQLVRSSYISGFCLLMRRQLYETLGPFDPAFARGLWADHDYCRRAQDMGLFSAVALDALVVHLGGRTMGRGSEALRRANLDAERLFVGRWGYKQGVYWCPETDLCTPAAAGQMRLLFNLADRGNHFFVGLAAGQRPEKILASHGLPGHTNVHFERSRLPEPLRGMWLGYRFRYQRHKKRVQLRHRGDLFGLNLRCLPLAQLPPEEVGVTYRGK